MPPLTGGVLPRVHFLTQNDIHLPSLPRSIRLATRSKIKLSYLFLKQNFFQKKLRALS